MIRRTVRTTLVAATCTTVLAGGLAACGAVKELSAAEKVSDAFGKLADGKSFSAKLSVDATSAQIQAFGTATDAKIDAKSADALAALSLSFAVSADKPLKDLEILKNPAGATSTEALTADKSVSYSYALAGKGGKSLVELRQADGKTYLQADVKAAAELFGQDASELDSMSEFLPASLKGALSGKWISIDPKTLEEFTKTVGEAVPGATGAKPSAQPTVNPEVAKSFVNAVKDVFSRDTSFEDKGKKDGKQLIVVTASTRTVANDLLKAVEPLAKEIPAMGKVPTAVPSDVPDKKLALNVLLDGGALSSISFDIAQLDDKAAVGATLPVKISFGKDVPAIQAPSGATEITTADIESIFGSLAEAGGGAGGLGAGGLGAGSLGGGLGGSGLPEAETLTDAQVKELTASTSLTEQQIKTYNKLGLTYEDIKDMGKSAS